MDYRGATACRNTKNNSKVLYLIHWHSFLLVVFLGPLLHVFLDLLGRLDLLLVLPLCVLPGGGRLLQPRQVNPQPPQKIEILT